MIKSYFYKVLENPKNRAKLGSLKGKKEVYQLFFENGYTKDFNSFEKELNELLNSAEIQELVDKGHYEFSSEMLANVSGGAGASRRVLVGGIAALMAALSLSTSASAIKTADIGCSELSYSSSTSSNFDPADVGNNQKPKTMVEEIVEKKLELDKKRTEKHKKFLQKGLGLRKAFKNRRNNVNMHNDDKQNNNN